MVENNIPRLMDAYTILFIEWFINPFCWRDVRFKGLCLLRNTILNVNKNKDVEELHKRVVGLETNEFKDLQNPEEKH